MTAYPLINPDRFDSVLAFRRREPITAKQFLADVADLGATLPAHRHAIILCKDRYLFTVGFAAALSRGQISLLPPNDTPSVLSQLARDYPDSYCLIDADLPQSPLPSWTVPEPRLGSGPAPNIPEIPANQIAVMLFTSGSTGSPTAHARTWGTLVRSTLAAGGRLGISKFPDAALVGTVPHHHSYGLESTVMLALQHRLALCSERPFFPADIFSSLEILRRPRILVTTPIHLRALSEESGKFPGVDLLISATAPLPPQLAAEAEKRFGAPLHEIYGCSEAGQIATRRTVLTEEWRCLSDIRLHSDERGIWVGGALIDTETALNDAIELRGADTFLLHGRKRDMINIAGKRSSLAHLNFQLNSIEGVRDGVFVMPAEANGPVTRLIAFVVAPGLSADTILSGLRQRIDAAFLPRPLCLVDVLPRNALGKLPRDDITRLVATANER